MTTWVATLELASHLVAPVAPVKAVVTLTPLEVNTPAQEDAGEAVVGISAAAGLVVA